MLRTQGSLETYCATVRWRWLVFLFLFFLVMEHRWNETERGKPKYVGGGEPVPVSLCPPQIPHGLTRDRTRASAWAMARPTITTYSLPQTQNNPGVNPTFIPTVLEATGSKQRVSILYIFDYDITFIIYWFLDLVDSYSHKKQGLGRNWISSRSLVLLV
jgi:hypothetical protein